MGFTLRRSSLAGRTVRVLCISIPLASNLFYKPQTGMWQNR